MLLQQQQQQGGVLGRLIKPGWEAAETVLPFLHKCLLALLAVLLYTAQHNPGPLRVHLLCMAGLTLGLWASITWFVGEYRRALVQAKAGETEGAAGNGEGSKGERDGKQATAAAVSKGEPKPVRYTD